MANHNLPLTTSTYVNFVSELDGRLDDLAVGLDPAVTTATNVPTNSIRWNSASKYWEKYNGTAWVVNSTAYNVNINGSVGATTASTGAFTTLSSNSTTALASGTTIGGNTAVTVSDTQTLTNKTLTSPTIGTIVNTGTLTLPTSTDTIVGRATTDTLTNKTLTAPRFADLGFIADSAGNELVIFDSNTTAVNEVTIANAASGDGSTTGRPTISATGGDTNISLNLVSKGTGTVQVNGVTAVTTSGSQTLTNKTLTSPVISTISNTGTLTLPTSTDTLVGRATTDTLTNKTMSTSSTWNGNTVGVTYGGTGTSTAPIQGGVIYGASTTAYASTAVGTAYQVLQSNGTAAPTWVNLDLSLHVADSSYKKIVRAATSTNLDASTFAADVLTGYSNAQTLALTTTAASTTITTTSTAGLKVGAVVNAATTQIAAGTTVASISNSTTFVVTNRAAIATTAITGTGATATATFAAQTYVPYAVGSTITITGATPATYNGSFVVTACTTTSVSWASAETVTATVQGSIAFNIAAGTSVNHNFSQTIAALAIDGITLAVNDRILVKDQEFFAGLQATDTAKYNGIYYVSATGSTTVPWTLTRATDANSSTDIDGAIVNVSVGTANGGKSFKTYFTGTSTLNTTPMYWNRIVDVSSSGLIGLPTTAVGIDIATDTKTQTLVTGAVADLAINSLGVTTVKATGASTYTRASTLYIAGAPAASTNATITTPYALYVAAGNSNFGGTVNGLTFASNSVSSAAATALSITSGTTGAATLDSGSTGAVNVGTNANAKTITIGNSTGATAVDIITGTGNLDITTPLVTISGDLTVTGGDIKTGAAVASTLFSDTTTGNIAVAGALSTGTFTVGATGSTGAVSLFPATGSQAISLGAATTGTVTLGSTSATAVQLPTGKTKIGQSFLAQGGAVTATLPTAAGTLVGSGDTGTVTNAMLAGSIADSKLNQITTASKVSTSAITGTLAVGNGGTGGTTAIDALVSLGERTASTGSVKLPVGTTLERDASAAQGYIRFNSTVLKFEGYNGTAWAAVGGGATGAGGDEVFVENGQTVNTSYTMTTGKNAMSAGPITVATGVTVTIPSGSRWVIV